MHLNNLSDSQSVELLQKGDRDAFENIYKNYWYKMYCVAYNILGVKEECEELVQDIFENLWKNRNQNHIQHLSSYLIVSVKHRCNNTIRTQINQRKFQEFQIFHQIQQNSNTDEIINYNDLNLAVEKALSNMPEKTSEIFKRSRFEKQTNKFIAQELNLTEKAVEYHITKSIKALKEELKLYTLDD